MARQALSSPLKWIVLVTVVALVCLWTYMPGSSTTGKFTADYKNNVFLKDGIPFDYVSGSLHYFRVPREFWRDRLLKLRAGGINVVSTYVAWNVHEPHPGQFNFVGDADIVEFIKVAESLGLYVNVRPGPYICAEWDLGGMPYFVLGSPKNKVNIRTADQMFTEHVERYFKELLTRLKPHLYEFGGPVIMVQVENEYGSYKACDYDYTAWLTELMQKLLGPNVVLYTADGWDMHHLACGPIHNKDVLTTVNFGPKSNHKAAFSRLRSFQGHGPLVNSEYYPGWLDHWNETHNCRSSELVLSEFSKMLASEMGKIHVNFYMYFGGTNFGFYNGANFNVKYQPDPTSYDYDAPLSECGDMTNKYHAIRKEIKKYLPHLVDDDILSQVRDSEKKSYGKVVFTHMLPFTDIKSLATKNLNSAPLYTFEELQQDFGFVLYETDAMKTNDESELEITDPRDMVYVFADNKYIGKIYRNSMQLKLSLPPFKRLSLLVENMGRINYGPNMHDFKGLLGSVKIAKNDLSRVSDWNIWTLPLNNTATAKFEKSASRKNAGPGSFLRGTFKVTGVPADTWVNVGSFTKGVIFVNNRNIGRYWPKVGPQKHLYVPSVWLKEGINQLTIFELEEMPQSELLVELVDQPDIGSCALDT